MKIVDRLLNTFGLARRDALNDPEIVQMLLGDGASASGVQVTVSAAHTSTVVYACIRVIAETMASLPLKLYRRTADGGREEDTAHPLHYVLHTRANARQTAFELREQLFGALKSWGNAYAEIETNGRGDVLGLWPLRPDRVRPVLLEDNTLAYVITLPDNRRVGLPGYKMLHLREMSFDGIEGLSPIGQARNAIGLALATEEYGARFFKNGASPGTVLKTPGKLSKQAYERLLTSWEGRHMGLSNAMRTSILEEGLDLQNIGVPNRDSEFLETRKYQASEIARIFRVPPHKIGILDNATFSNIEHQAIEFVTDTVRPNAVRFEQVIARDLMGRREAVTLYAEHVLDGLLRGDTLTRYQSYAIGRQWGWFSVNDVLRRENMNPVDGGDRHDSPLNMQPLASAQNEPAAEQAPAAGRAIDNGLDLWRDDTVARIAARVAPDFDAKHSAWMADALRPLATARGAAAPDVTARYAAELILQSRDVGASVKTAGL